MQKNYLKQVKPRQVQHYLAY